MLPTVYFYVLRDPTTKAVRYVGSTIDPKQRAVAHKFNPTRRCRRWVEDLRTSGLAPTMDVVDTMVCDDDRRWSRESEIIREHIASGAALFNLQMRRGRGGLSVTIRITPNEVDWIDFLRNPDESRSAFIARCARLGLDKMDADRDAGIPWKRQEPRGPVPASRRAKRTGAAS